MDFRQCLFLSHFYIREFFFTLSVSNGSILMGNDQPCRIEDVVLVQIRMFDGINRTLIHVRFKSNVRKNLISLEVLDLHNLEWNSRRDVLDVISCDTKFILPGIQEKSVFCRGYHYL